MSIVHADVPTLSLYLLGNLQMTLGERALTAPTAKASALLCYLAVTAQPHSRQHLVDLLWSEMGEAQARRNLTATLTTLRKVAAPYLLVETERIALAHAPHYVDLLEFQRLLREGRATADGSKLRHAVDLYRGDFLHDLTVKEATGFEEWVLTWREHLREQMLQALQLLVDQAVAQADDAGGIAYATRLLHMDPWRESAHRQLMVLYAQTGRMNAAIAQFELCRKILREELGIDPTAETLTLYERLLTADAPPVHNLPEQPTRFVGRSAELAQIVNQLADPACRLLTILGPGGIGKTRLALEAARHYINLPTQPLATSFANGVYFVALANVVAEASTPTPPLSSTPLPFVTALAEAMGLTLQSARSPRQQLLDALRGKQLLLVLDNFEHLLNEQGSTPELSLVTELLRQLPSLKLLVTSRARLHLRDEWVVELVGLTQANAHLLFTHLARQVRGAPLAPADDVHITRICQLTSGVPLALELAASWLRALACREVAQEIERSLDFLTTTWRDLPERHRSLRAVFAQSWRMLTPTERTVFQQLTILRNSFTREAAHAIAGATLATLAALVDKSLIRLRADGRYELHELLRQYGAALLAEEAAQEAHTRDRHSAYYCGRLAAWGLALRGAQQRSVLEEFDLDHNEINSAWEWAVRQRQLARIAAGLEAIGIFIDRRGGYFEGRTLFDLTITHFADLGNALALATLVRLLCWQSNIHRELGEIELARQALTRAQTLLQDPALQAHDLRLEQAHLFYRQARLAVINDRDRAYQLMGESLAYFRALADPWWTAHTLGWLAEIDYERGQLDRAQRLCQESLTLWQGMGAPDGIATMLTLLGWIALSKGKFAEALAQQAEALRCFRALGTPTLVTGALRNLGAAQFFAGDFDEAEKSLLESIRGYTQLGNRSATVFPLILHGAVQLQRGNYAAAGDLLQQALQLAHDYSDDPGIAHAQHWLGRYEVARNHLLVAQALLESSLQAFRTLQQSEQVSATLATLALVAHLAGDRQRANSHFAEALDLAATLGVTLPLFVLAPLAVTLGQVDHYREKLGDEPDKILALPFMGGSSGDRRLSYIDAPALDSGCAPCADAGSSG